MNHQRCLSWTKLNHYKGKLIVIRVQVRGAAAMEIMLWEHVLTQEVPQELNAQYREIARQCDTGILCFQ